MSYGPWSPGLDDAERRCQLRSLAALAAVHLGSLSPLVLALRRAEVDAAALDEARAMVERLPSLTRRKMLSTFGAVTWPRQLSRSGDAR